MDCGTVLLRPCTTAFRHTGDTPVGHIDDEGRDLNWRDEGYTESRCTGVCMRVCMCQRAQDEEAHMAARVHDIVYMHVSGPCYKV